jgi:hypothetical protein
MLFGETVDVFCDNHTEHTDTMCGQNAEFLALKYILHKVTAGLISEHHKTDIKQKNKNKTPTSIKLEAV